MTRPDRRPPSSLRGARGRDSQATREREGQQIVESAAECAGRDGLVVRGTGARAHVVSRGRARAPDFLPVVRRGDDVVCRARFVPRSQLSKVHQDFQRRERGSIFSTAAAYGTGDVHHALSLAGGHPLPLLVALSLLARLDLAKGRWNSDAARFAPVQTTRTAIARDTSALDFDRVYFLSSWIIHGSDDRDLPRFFGSPLSRNVSGFKK
jgi:hypothetical protein